MIELVGITPPEEEEGETSNWKTSVHIPELNIGPVKKKTIEAKKFI